jgi:hypothetical protein
MRCQSAEDRFWETLSELLRPDAPDHNRRMVTDFARVSGIDEGTIWRKLRGRLHPEKATQ